MNNQRYVSGEGWKQKKKKNMPKMSPNLMKTNPTEIQPVHSEGDQPWDFFGRNDDKAETPVLWPPHAKS